MIWAHFLALDHYLQLTKKKFKKVLVEVGVWTHDLTLRNGHLKLEFQGLYLSSCFRGPLNFEIWLSTHLTIKNACLDTLSPNSITIFGIFKNRHLRKKAVIGLIGCEQDVNSKFELTRKLRSLLRQLKMCRDTLLQQEKNSRK